MANTILDFILLFCGILYEALPFVVLGATIAGILEELTPRQAFAFMMGVSVFLLTLILAPLPLPMRIALGLTGATVLCLALLRCQAFIAAVLGWLGRHRVGAIAMSGLLGLIMPMCECGIIPVMRRLLRKEMPLSCCVAYLLAGPIINIVVLLSTYMAFAGMETNVDTSGRLTYQAGGVSMFLLRAGMAWVVAFVTALVVERQYRIHGDELLTPLSRPSRTDEPAMASAATSTAIQKPDDQITHKAPAPAPAGGPLGDVDVSLQKPLWQRLGNVSETALHDFVDIAVFLIIGALLSCFARTLIGPETVEEVSRSRPAVAIAAMMLLAVLLCLCSEADAFVAASFIALRPGAKLAFLVLGPMLDLKLYMMYLRVFRPRLIWTIIPCVVVQVLVYSLIIHFLWERYAPLLRGAPAP